MAINSDTVAEPVEGEQITAEELNKEDSDLLQTVVIVAGIAIVLISIVMISVYKITGKKQQQSSHSELTAPVERPSVVNASEISQFESSINVD